MLWARLTSRQTLNSQAPNLSDPTLDAWLYLKTLIRALLPGFCNNPVDLKENFKGLAKTVGEHLQQRKELRLDILVKFRLTRNSR